jgi:aryl-alcohol dehydrogenase-like predicted oxidoreductase
MGMSDFYGPSDRSENIATLRAALDANVTLLDTGDFYGMGHNEMLISEAIQNRPLGHGRRRLIWYAVTAHPTAEWLARQITEAFP